MELYAFATPNSIKPLILLEELGLDYELKVINIKKGEQKKSEFLKINPNGKVPVLKIGTSTVTESAAILIYLAEQHGKYIPTDSAERIRMFEWLFFHASSLGPSFGQAGYFKKLAPEKIPLAINRFNGEAVRTLSILNDRLSDHSYLCDEYSIADIANFGWIWRREFAEVSLVDLPNVQRWYDEILHRPAVQRSLKILDQIAI